MLDVFVAMSAPGFIRGSRDAYNACFASMFSKIASITRSVSGTREPSTSGTRRAVASAIFSGVLSFFANMSFARSSAGCTYFISRSCSETSKPCTAHQAAMSPPITPAPTTCTLRMPLSALPPRLLSASCRKNTRTRLRAVGVPASLAVARGSARSIRPTLPPKRRHSSIIANGAG